MVHIADTFVEYLAGQLDANSNNPAGLRAALRRAYPEHRENSWADRIEKKGVVDSLTFPETLQYENVLSPREYSLLRQALYLTNQNDILSVLCSRKDYWFEGRDAQQFKSCSDWDTGTFLQEKSFWTGHGLGWYDRRIVMAKISSLDAQSRSLPDETLQVVHPRQFCGEYDYIGGWEPLGQGLFTPKSSYTENLHDVDQFMGHLHYNDPWSLDRCQFGPIAFVHVTEPANGARSPRMELVVADNGHCDVSPPSQTKLSALTCLNKNGKNPDFPETIEELVGGIFSEFFSNLGAVEKSGYFLWSKADQILEFLAEKALKKEEFERNSEESYPEQFYWSGVNDLFKYPVVSGKRRPHFSRAALSPDSEFVKNMEKGKYLLDAERRLFYCWLTRRFVTKE